MQAALRYVMCFAASQQAMDFMLSCVSVDVMLLGIRMPGKSGLEIMQKSTGRVVANPPYPTIAMTRHVNAESLEGFRCIIRVMLLHDELQFTLAQPEATSPLFHIFIEYVLRVCCSQVCVRVLKVV